MNVVHENILVELVEPVKKKNGVILPEEDIVKERSGKVVRYGEGVPKALGDIFNRSPEVKYKEYYDGEEITLKGVKYAVMNYKDILIIN